MIEKIDIDLSIYNDLLILRLVLCLKEKIAQYKRAESKRIIKLVDRVTAGKGKKTTKTHFSIIYIERREMLRVL